MSSSVAKDLEKKIVAWLDAHGNKIELNINEGELKQCTPTMFTCSTPQTFISISFKHPILKDKVNLEELQRNFSFIALNQLSLPDLDVPSNWEVQPQTSMSSFDEGVTIEAYENGRLRVTIVTQFFAIDGQQEQRNPTMDKQADEGTYFQVRRDIKGTIKLDMPLVFE
ncbi:unnamed protein product [Rotaria sordida]|uniref:Uncharacterized protein n=1 Tax=Rotaria sordida TaxID=392033 RepID=A0A814C0L2_9BILA|nr:unnamed protein product [Rotaria sordida]CAF1005874.1 unnamed protein product [Rotaria sordida]CAF3594539.1 unnamed protein product [Rotaria sordida]